MKKIGFMALSMLTLVVSAYADKSINQDVTPGSFTKGYTLDANGIYHVTVTAIDGWSFDGDSTVSGSGWIPEGTHGAKLNKKYSFNDPALETVTLRGFLKKNETGSGGDRPKYTADFVAKKYYIVATDPEKAKNEDEIYILSTETGTIQSYENKTLVPSDWTFTPTLEGKMVTVGGKNTVTVGAGGDVTEPGIYKVVAKYKSQQDDIDLGIIEVKLKSVDFTGDKNYIMKKTSTATYYIDDKYASDGPVTIAYPELRLDKEGKQIEQLEPACYKMLAVPATAIVLYVKPDLSIHPISARIQIINNGSPCCEGEVSLNSSEATTGNLLWDSSYASVNVNKTYETCEWKIHLEGRSKFTSLGDRKKCTLFSVYAAPRGSSPTSV